MSDFPSKEKALGMYKKMYEIRKYEESIYYLFLEGIMPGTIHQSTGEEASAVGMLYDLSHEDWMASTHRPAGCARCSAKRRAAAAVRVAPCTPVTSPWVP